MKILLLVHGLGVGGAESMIGHLARHLRAAGDTVAIDCLGVLGSIGEELRADGIPVVVHARRPGFDATLPWRLARRVRAGGFDVVHAHQRTALFYGALAAFLYTTPLIYTEHSPAVGRPPNRRQRLVNRLLGRQVKRITAVSCDAARSLVAVEGFAGRQIVVVPNGVDCAHWAAAATVGCAAARARCGLPPRAAILGSVGRLHAVKNQQLLVRVIAHLRPRIPDIALVLVGDGPERGALHALAGRLGVADAVHFLGLRRDVERILPAFDVFCLSSRSEGIPLTLLEAMAARVPILALAVGGIPEAVRADMEALLVVPAGGAHRLPAADAHDVVQFSAAAQRLLTDAALRQRLTARAGARVSADFGLEVVCRRYREILAAAVG